MNANHSKTPQQDGFSRRDIMAVGTAVGAWLATTTEAQGADTGEAAASPAPPELLSH